MRYPIIGSVLLGVALATSVAAQPTSYSSSNARTLGATISSGEETGFSAGNGILYQMSGTTEISTAGNIRTIRTGEGMFIPGGSRVTLRALGSEPSTYLQFLLSSASNLDQPDLS